ncbi:MAG: hypothetical protein LBC31_05215 [Treponema sp.]|nr:hypothetical protein [Treponema sp.]
MRKPIVPRFVFLLVLFTVVFILLVQFQFGKKTNFTLRAGDLVIQGSYGTPPAVQMPNTYPLEGQVSVFFGGIEFSPGEVVLAGSTIRPHLMTLTDNGVYFEFPGGPELFFATQYTGGTIELVIRSDFSGMEYDTLKVPFKPLATSRVTRNNFSFLLNADGVRYTFSRDTGEGHILLDLQNPAISYRVVPDRPTASPQDFFLPAALNEEEYEASLNLWLDQSYSFWNRILSPGAEIEGAERGEMISAYMSEALKRGTYKAAAIAVSTSYNPALSSYEASAYVDRMEGALRSLATAERERSARFARLFNEKSMDFLKEFHTVEFLGVRSYNNLMDDAAEMLRTFDPAEMTVEHAAGFLEGRPDWERYRPGRNNPYERFIDQAMYVVTESLRKIPSGGRAAGSLVFSGDEADTELNLRLGSALLRYGDSVKISLGRTLILSVLSLADSAGAVPRTLIRTAENIAAKPGGGLLGSYRIYRICRAGDYYARAQLLGSGLWAWTAASSINGAPGRNTMDITVNFPPGETHYLLIRGIRPFTALQFNGTDSPQDPQFERYDASGWAYSTAEQTLLIKLRHRAATERITVVY